MYFTLFNLKMNNPRQLAPDQRRAVEDEYSKYQRLGSELERRERAKLQGAIPDS